MKGILLPYQVAVRRTTAAPSRRRGHVVPRLIGWFYFRVLRTLHLYPAPLARTLTASIVGGAGSSLQLFSSCELAAPSGLQYHRGHSLQWVADAHEYAMGKRGKWGLGRMRQCTCKSPSNAAAILNGSRAVVQALKRSWLGLTRPIRAILTNDDGQASNT